MPEPAQHTVFDHYFMEILTGFLRNARRTSGSFAVCDFPEGTRHKSCVARSGKTYVSVARMLPAIAAWMRSGRQPTRFQVEEGELELTDVLLATFRNAFDPAHPDYWGEPPPGRASQIQVEAALVAYSLWQLGDDFLERLTPAERARIQAWLASCTRVPERSHNHAWFSAVNQAARLALSARWQEFSGDEAWMLDDLRALDGMAAAGDDGWYSDAPHIPTYDYYNFWVFASFPLLWSHTIGPRYPEWDARFRERVRQFLVKTPYFFGANGSHVLFGRSLIYRWAVLTPLVLAYQEKLWPHAPGLLRRIARRSLEFHWSLGAFDPVHGKLRETFSEGGNPEIREFYIDNGHPLWCMQSFALFGIPEEGPFWHAPEEPLPVEQGDFLVRFPGPRMLLAGTQGSGQVRWLQAQNAPRREYYRDKYVKFSYSSHFPFNSLQEQERCPWDATLALRDPRTGACAGRAGVRRGELLPDGVQTEWWIQIGERVWEVSSQVRVDGEFELRAHVITAPDSSDAGIEILEGSYPLGLMEGEAYEQERGHDWQWLRSRRSGHLLVTWNLAGYATIEASQSFSEIGRKDVNIISPRMVVSTLRGAAAGGRAETASLHYASPRPLPREEIFRRAGEIMAIWQAGRCDRGDQAT